MSHFEDITGAVARLAACYAPDPSVSVGWNSQEARRYRAYRITERSLLPLRPHLWGEEAGVESFPKSWRFQALWRAEWAEITEVFG